LGRPEAWAREAGRGGLWFFYYLFLQDRLIWFVTMYGKDDVACGLKAAVGESQRQRARRWSPGGSSDAENEEAGGHAERLPRTHGRCQRQARAPRSRLALNTHDVDPIVLPGHERASGRARGSRIALHVAPPVLAFKLGVNPRPSNAGSGVGACPTSGPNELAAP